MKLQSCKNEALKSRLLSAAYIDVFSDDDADLVLQFRGNGLAYLYEIRGDSDLVSWAFERLCEGHSFKKRIQDIKNYERGPSKQWALIPAGYRALKDVSEVVRGGAHGNSAPIWIEGVPGDFAF